MTLPSVRTCSASSGEHDSVRKTMTIFDNKVSDISTGIRMMMDHLLVEAGGENQDGAVQDRLGGAAKYLVDET